MLGSRTKPDRAELYRALSLATDHGLDPIRAIQSASPDLSGTLRAAIEAEASLAEAVNHALGAPELELEILRAAERSGRLPEAFRELADDLEEEARARRRAVGRCAYPALVIHLVPVAVNASLLLSTPAGFAIAITRWWLLLWAVAAAVFLFARWLSRSPVSRATLRRLPLIGRLEVEGQLLRFLSALRWLHGSGVLWREAIPVARRCAARSGVLPEIEAAERTARADASMEQTLARLHSLDAGLSAPLQTAAHVGGLDGALARCVELLRERRHRQLDRLARATGGLLYLSALGLVVWTILRFYTDYFGQLR